MEPTILYNDDWDSRCAELANRFEESIPEMFPSLAYGDWSDEIRDILHILNVPSDEIEQTVLAIERDGNNDDEAAQYLKAEFEKIASEQGRDRVEEVLFQQLSMHSAVIDSFYQNAEDDLRSSMEELGIDGASEGKPHSYLLIDGNQADCAEGKDAFDFIAETYGEELSQCANEVSYLEGKPCLHFAGDNQNIGFSYECDLIPDVWAREAYMSKAFHDVLCDHLEDESVFQFLSENQAIPEIEKDPLTFGIAHDLYTNAVYTDENGIKEMASALSKFKMQDFFKYSEDEYYGGIPAGLKQVTSPSRAYAAEEEIHKCFDHFMDDLRRNVRKGKKPNDSALLKGIEKTLESRNFDTIYNNIGGFVHGEKKAIQSLQKLGASEIRKTSSVER